MNFKSGDVVQVMSDKEHAGSLWIVEKQIESITLVYSLGKNRVNTHFHSDFLALIGKAEMITPSKYQQ